MKHLIRIVILAVCFQVHGEPSKENFYTQAERAVVHLERQTGPNTYAPEGTGFFIQSEDGALFIVTARHVAALGDLRARVPSLLVKEQRTDVIELRLPHERWINHPNAGDANTWPVDVSVMKLGGIKDRTIVSFNYCPTKCPDGQYNQVAADPMPPDFVEVFGFPVDLGFKLKEQRPMMRLGAVAFVASEQFMSIRAAVDQPEKQVPKGAYLVDARMFPGNSGGPVIVANPYSPVRLGGLVTGTSRELDFGIITPVTQIAETLEAAKNTEPNMDAWHELN